MDGSSDHCVYKYICHAHCVHPTWCKCDRLENRLRPKTVVLRPSTDTILYYILAENPKRGIKRNDENRCLSCACFVQRYYIMPTSCRVSDERNSDGSDEKNSWPTTVVIIDYTSSVDRVCWTFFKALIE